MNELAQLLQIQEECTRLKTEAKGLSVRLEEQEKASKEKLALLDDARQKLSDAFKALSQEALKSPARNHKNDERNDDLYQ